MSRARAVRISAHHPVPIVKAKQDCANGARRIDREVQRSIGIRGQTDTPQYGLIAEEVAEVNPDLVIYDADGKPYTVRYEAINAMLLNKFLKEHRKNKEQEATIARLVAADTHQQKQIEALTAALQRVSAQLELSKSISKRF